MALVTRSVDGFASGTRENEINWIWFDFTLDWICLKQKTDSIIILISFSAYLLEQLAGKNETTKDEILERISDYCGKPVTDYTKDEYEIPYTWTFYHAFFFAFTVCSTVGYGNISPTTFAGRIVMIVYSVIGIPVNGILFAGLGEYFGRTVSRALECVVWSDPWLIPIPFAVRGHL